MATTDYKLVEHRFAHTDSSLQIKMTASISLSSEFASRFPFSQIFHDINNFAAARFWIDGNNSFEFSFSLSTTEYAEEYVDVSAHAEQLGAVLCDGEVLPSRLAKLIGPAG